MKFQPGDDIVRKEWIKYPYLKGEIISSNGEYYGVKWSNGEIRYHSEFSLQNYEIGPAAKRRLKIRSIMNLLF